ncbi:MAG: Bax inhibitor-1/YccA family protein [Clostridia bacterium]|nr:Bax inhibitor-1/YccA family protein [Clostridia bacterium]
MENSQNKILSKTFFWMFLGLLGTGLVAFYTYASGLYLSIFSSNSIGIIALIEVVVVLVFSFLFRKLPPIVVGILYFIYAFINGFTFSSIFAIYEISSIAFVFFLTAILYAVLAFCGYKTNIDVSKWSTILFIALIVSLIASIINIFIGNSLLDIALNWLIIFIFAGYTIYDMHVLRELQNDQSLNSEKIYIYCAMQLYLDFINLFIRLLRVFGRSRD